MFDPITATPQQLRLAIKSLDNRICKISSDGAELDNQRRNFPNFWTEQDQTILDEMRAEIDNAIYLERVCSLGLA